MNRIGRTQVCPINKKLPRKHGGSKKGRYTMFRWELFLSFCMCGEPDESGRPRPDWR